MNRIATSALLTLALSSAPALAATASSAESEDAGASNEITVISVDMGHDSAAIDVEAAGGAYTIHVLDGGSRAAVYSGEDFIAGWAVSDETGSAASNADGEIYTYPDETGVDLQAIALAEGEMIAALLDPAFHSSVLESEEPDRWVWFAAAAVLYLVSCVDYEVTNTYDADGNLTGTEETYGFDCDFPLETDGGLGDEPVAPVGDGGFSNPEFTSLDLTVETSQPSAGSCTVDIEMLVQGNFGPEDEESLQFGLFSEEGAAGTLALTSEIDHDYGYVDVAGGIHHYGASILVDEGTSGMIYAGVEQSAGFVAENALEWNCECAALQGDLDGDGSVGVSDLLMFNTQYGTVGASPADLDGDGVVAVADLMIILGEFGQQGC